MSLSLQGTLDPAFAWPACRPAHAPGKAKAGSPLSPPGRVSPVGFPLGLAACLGPSVGRYSKICRNLFWAFLYTFGFSFKAHKTPLHPLGSVILACHVGLTGCCPKAWVFWEGRRGKHICKPWDLTTGQDHLTSGARYPPPPPLPEGHPPKYLILKGRFGPLSGEIPINTNIRRKSVSPDEVPEGVVPEASLLSCYS